MLELLILLSKCTIFMHLIYFKMYKLFPLEGLRSTNHNLKIPWETTDSKFNGIVHPKTKILILLQKRRHLLIHWGHIDHITKDVCFLEGLHLGTHSLLDSQIYNTFQIVSSSILKQTNKQKTAKLVSY